MVQKTTTLLPNGCRLITLPGVQDERGFLTFAEGQNHIPFRIDRVFWIYGVPEGKERGGHAHRTCAEVVVPVAGAFTMVVDDGTLRVSVRLDSPQTGILIPAGVWCELKDFAPGTVCVVAASQAYDSEGYIHCYDEYMKQK